MKALQQPVIKQSLIDQDAVILENINRVLKGQIRPISKISDLSAKEWFDLARRLLSYDVGLYRHALLFGAEMAQKAMPPVIYMR